MEYQNCIDEMQAAHGDGADASPDNIQINPATGLASDYLNHFNEAIMLLELMADCPDCRDDLLRWRPLGYREHFAASGFKDRVLAINAYENADPHARACLDALAASMTAVIETMRTAIIADMPGAAIATSAARAAAGLKPLVARAGAVINGDGDRPDPTMPQAVADELMQR